MKSNRIVYFDVLNILACLAVVFMHCNNMVHVYAPGPNWLCSLVIEVVCWWAVPIFLMLSGATLMRYRDRYDTKTFFKKRVVRTFVPFLLWSIFIYIVRFGITATPEEAAKFGLLDFWTLFMSNGIEGVYWFFFPLFALYLAYPALSLLANERKVLWYLAGTFFVLQSIIPPVLGMLKLPWNPSISQPMVTTFVFYAILGYLASTEEFSKKTRLAIYSLGLFAILFRYVYMALMSAQVGEVVKTTSIDYGYFTGVLPALAAFVFFKQVDFSSFNDRTIGVIAKVASCSFGVYLIHRLFIHDLLAVVLKVPQTSIALRTIAPILIWFACVLIVLALKKVPVLRRVVP